MHFAKHLYSRSSFFRNRICVVIHSMHELGVDVEFIGRNASCLRNDLISDYVGKASFFELQMRNEPNAGLQRGARSASELKGKLT